jgi:hypothetical protein
MLKEVDNTQRNAITVADENYVHVSKLFRDETRLPHHIALFHEDLVERANWRGAIPNYGGNDAECFYEAIVHLLREARKKLIGAFSLP